MFWLGLFVGANLGFLLYAFCAMSKTADEVDDAIKQEKRNEHEE